MAKLLIVATHGPDNPNRATTPFNVAKAARESNIDVSLFLTNDAVLIAKDGVADPIRSVGVGIPPLKDLLKYAIETKIPIYVCTPCAKARKVTEADCVKNVVFTGAKKLASLATEGSTLCF